MALQDDLFAEVEKIDSVGNSVLTLIQKLVDSSGGDPVKLQAAIDKLKTQTAEFEAAIVANTPVEPPTE